MGLTDLVDVVLRYDVIETGVEIVQEVHNLHTITCETREVDCLMYLF